MIARIWRGWTRAEDEAFPEDDRFLVGRELTVVHYEFKAAE